MTALALEIRRIRHGWAVYATNGQELVRYRGVGAQQRALDFARSWAH
jgi:hypothetical protein